MRIVGPDPDQVMGWQGLLLVVDVMPAAALFDPEQLSEIVAVDRESIPGVTRSRDMGHVITRGEIVPT